MSEGVVTSISVGGATSYSEWIYGGTCLSSRVILNSLARLRNACARYECAELFKWRRFTPRAAVQMDQLTARVVLESM